MLEKTLRMHRGQVSSEVTRMEQLMEVSCDPTCGFNIRSHDKKELTKFVQSHAKNMHRMNMTTKDVEAKMMAA